jgi:arylsulfatase A-like enzyme
MVGQRRNDSLVQLMDIAPTILEAAGVVPPASF